MDRVVVAMRCRSILKKIKKLVKMREAMARLESEARQEAVRMAEERKEREEELGHKLGGPKPKALSGEPADKAQSNFTDWRPVRSGATSPRAVRNTEPRQQRATRRSARGREPGRCGHGFDGEGGEATIDYASTWVEPVFGQIKEARGFRRFLRRGLENVSGEWALLCTVHDMLKLAAFLGVVGV